jgi:hypothetical protein
MAYINWTTQFGTTTSTTDVVISTGMEIEINSSVTARDITVSGNGKLRFAPASSAKLDVYGNFVVTGTGELIMQPQSASQVHHIQFRDIDMESFVGSADHSMAEHHMVHPTDRGLWVMQGAMLRANGTAKTAHVRLLGQASVGETVIACETAPTGWQAGDLIVVTPMQTPDYPQFWDAYDEANLVSVTGSNVTLNAPLQHNHLVLTGDHPPEEWTGRTHWTARLLNLTRNVIIEGEPGKHGHIILQPSNAQSISNVLVRHMGPYRTASNGDITSVMGRYALHIHHAHEPVNYPAQRHTLTGVVVHKSGNRAFVPHIVTGVTLQNCISHEVQFHAWWWDGREDSKDIEYLDGVSSKTYKIGRPHSFRLAAVTLAQGENLKALRMLAVGTNSGNSTSHDSSGYTWAEGDSGLWIFEDNESFCNRRHGIFTWQNTSLFHDVDDTVCGWNGAKGIDHGAYKNAYNYNRMWLIGNVEAGILLHSSSGGGRRQRFFDISIEGKGITENAIMISHPQLLGSTSTLFDQIKVRDINGRLVVFTASGGVHPQLIRVSNWDHNVTNPDNYFLFNDNTRAGSTLQLRDFATDIPGFYDLLRFDTPGGTLVTAWNAKQFLLESDDFDNDISGTRILNELWPGNNGDPWDSSRWLTSGTGSGFHQIDSGRGRIRANNSFNTSRAAFVRKDGENLILKDVTVFGEYETNTTQNMTFSIRVRDDTLGNRYEVRRVMNTTNIRIMRVVNGNATSIAGEMPFLFGVGDKVNIDFRVSDASDGNPRIQLQFWDASLERPPGWNTEFTDSAAPETHKQPGAVSLVWHRGSGEGDLWVGSGFKVYDSTTTQPETSAPVALSWSQSPIEFSLIAGDIETLPTSFSINEDNIVSYDIVSDSTWLSASPSSGTVSGVGPHLINVTADSTGLSPGAYTGFLSLEAQGTIGDDLPVGIQVRIDVYPKGIYDYNPTTDEWVKMAASPEDLEALEARVEILETGFTDTLEDIEASITNANAAFNAIIG